MTYSLPYDNYSADPKATVEIAMETLDFVEQAWENVVDPNLGSIPSRRLVAAMAPTFADHGRREAFDFIEAKYKRASSEYNSVGVSDMLEFNRAEARWEILLELIREWKHYAQETYAEEQGDVIKKVEAGDFD